jgi:hypothetical protein
VHEGVLSQSLQTLDVESDWLDDNKLKQDRLPTKAKANAILNDG